MAFHRTLRLLKSTLNNNGFKTPFIVAKESSLKMPCIILMSPYLAANVGSVSRAMLNFGLHELRVVKPRCDIHSGEARMLAVGTVDVLENAKIFDTLEESIADLDQLIVTTNRNRSLSQIKNTPKQAAHAMIMPNAGNNQLTSGILFGREENGLTTDEIAFGNISVEIPTFEGYSALNLAQAVNVMGYECWQRVLELRQTEEVEWTSADKRQRPQWSHTKPMTKQHLNHFLGQLEAKLDRSILSRIEMRRNLTNHDAGGVVTDIGAAADNSVINSSGVGNTSTTDPEAYTPFYKTKIRHFFQKVSLFRDL